MSLNYAIATTHFTLTILISHAINMPTPTASFLANQTGTSTERQLTNFKMDGIRYTHLLIFDVAPVAPYLNASCESYSNCGVEKILKGKFKMTKNLRLRPLKLPIYAPPDEHTYHLIAKVDGDCTNDDRTKAVRAVNEYVADLRKANFTIDEIVSAVIEKFPSHVIRGYNFSSKNAPSSLVPSSSRFRTKLNLVSASDSEALAESLSQPPSAFPRKRQQKKSGPGILIPNQSPSYNYASPFPLRFFFQPQTLRPTPRLRLLQRLERLPSSPRMRPTSTTPSSSPTTRLQRPFRARERLTSFGPWQ